MFFDDEERRTVLRKTHLDDDAYNKTTSLECLVDTLMNIQVNAHHPDGDAPNASYPLKYALKPERTLKLSLAHETDDLVLQHIRGQFVSLGEVVESLLGDPVVDATFSMNTCPLLYPSWQMTPAMDKVPIYLERLRVPFSVCGQCRTPIRIRVSSAWFGVTSEYCDGFGITIPPLLPCRSCSR